MKENGQKVSRFGGEYASLRARKQESFGKQNTQFVCSSYASPRNQKGISQMLIQFRYNNSSTFDNSNKNPIHRTNLPDTFSGFHHQ